MSGFVQALRVRRMRHYKPVESRARGRPLTTVSKWIKDSTWVCCWRTGGRESLVRYKNVPMVRDSEIKYQ